MSRAELIDGRPELIEGGQGRIERNGLGDAAELAVWTCDKIVSPT